MNREKMIEEVCEHFDVTRPYGEQMVDYMLEKFGPLVEAAKEDSHYYTDMYCTCNLCKAIKQLEK